MIYSIYIHNIVMPLILLNIAGSIIYLGTQRSSGGVAGSVPSQQRSVYQGGSAHRGLGLPGAQGVRRHNEGAAQPCPYLSSVRSLPCARRGSQDECNCTGYSFTASSQPYLTLYPFHYKLS